MPRVKIDYVVSFSSEDPDHPASNLLAWEVSKKKWLCKKGESSCSIVLQLTKAVKISSVHIGAYHSALVEVLVARSEKASDQFQVLVPSCVFVSPGESRRDVAVERVRSFSGAQLAEGARSQRWDRVRLVCSQPYNKHCKYGLSFVHVDEPEDGPQTPAPPPPAPAAALPVRLLALDPLSSDEDDFRPGELFAQHLLKSSDSQGSASDTGAQIRQATSKALKNIAESSTKLVKTPISKPSSARDSAPTAGERPDRSRDSLLYTADDTRPHAKIDRVLERHKHQKERDDKPTAQAAPEQKERTDDSSHTSKEEKRTPKRKMSCSPPARDAPPSKRPHKHSGDSSSDRSSRKDEKRVKAQASSEENEREGPHTILRGVVLVLSGYENPERALVRNTALALGARVLRDWGAGCTHLICAFPGTPKMREARAAAGAALPVATAGWIRACADERRRLPWRWFATAPAERRPRPQPPPEQRSDTEGDTDEEIEKVVQKQKATPGGELGSSTEEEGGEEGSSGEEAGLAGALPDFFDGYTFALDGAAAAGPLARYVAAYGGLVLQAAELDADSAVDFVLDAGGGGRGGGAGGGARVTPRWLAACHAARRLLPPR